MKKSYSPAFKAQMVRELLKEEKSVNQLAAEHGLHPNQLYRWREIALAGLPSLFARASAQEQAAKEAAPEQQLHDLYAEIGKLTTQLTWLKKSCCNAACRSAGLA
jgi:transposase-like protein